MEESRTYANVGDEPVTEIDAEMFPYEVSMERQRQFCDLMETDGEDRIMFLNKMKIIS